MAITDNKEPDPIHNDKPETWEEVIKDYSNMNGWYPNNKEKEIKDEIISLMKSRNEFGRNKYGTALQPFNGRDNIVDAIQELFDAVVYLKNEFLETNHPATQKVYEGALTLLESAYILHIMKIGKDSKKNETV